jgi:hypothetical protein
MKIQSVNVTPAATPQYAPFVKTGIKMLNKHIKSNSILTGL